MRTSHAIERSGRAGGRPIAKWVAGWKEMAALGLDGIASDAGDGDRAGSSCRKIAVEDQSRWCCAEFVVSHSAFGFGSRGGTIVNKS